MAASNLTTVAYIYKRVYSDDQVGDLAMRDHPLMQKMAKRGGFTGSAFYYGIRYGNPAAVSATFSDAQSDQDTASATSKGIQLAASRKAKYGVIVLDGEAMAAAEGDRGAFLDLVTQETDGIIEEMGDRMAFDLYRDGVGARGRRSSAATNVITLVTADDARNFKVGMMVGASPNADLSSPRTGTTYVTSIDEDAGTITLNSAAAITSFADNDYLFANGDENATMEGLASHFPLTAPSASDTFRGLSAPGRSVDTRRLAGVRVDDTATSIEENAGLVGVKISQVGKRADSIFVNPINFWQVARRLNAKVEYEGGGKADYGFQYLSIHSPAGVLKMFADPDCPTNRGYVLRMDTLYIKHLRGFPHIVKDDGRPSLRAAAADSIEARARAWSNSICTQPGANGVFSI